ncbi:MAG: efflux RND transporter permease subunit, partial [Spirochaetaceae bacterium]|nr:efflux RND transporter permease subunit [Spirochaetaceae bacterium]
MNLSKLAVSKPTTIVLIFIILTALGIYSTLSLPIDLFPEMDLPYIAVITTYENAGPEEVERSITRPIESAVSSVTGIDNLFSTSSQGTSFVGLELLFGTNLDSAANEMRDRIDMIKGFLPEGIDPPMILKMDPAMIPIMNLSVTGSRTPEELRQITEDIIQPKIEQIDGVASVGISGGREKAILIDISRDRLEAYSLTVTQIAQMIGAQNIQAAGGIISEGDLNYTISTSGEFTSVEDIKNSVISYKVQGPEALGQAPSVKSIKLRDIADVYEGYKKESSLAYLNGIPGVMLSIQKQSGKNSVATADAVTERLAEIEKDLPKDIQIIEISNTTNIIKDSISNVTSSAVQGAILAIIVLFIFLRSLKSTLIIGITIPISLIITLGVMYFTGFTLNIMTLAGLALGVGMLVDNSIVILENIYSYRERGTKAAVAAVLGSQEMLMAITASTLTTICVFLPLIMYKQKLGIMGQLFEGLTFTVVFSLLCSLIVAIILVPVLASKYFKLESLQNRNYKGILGWIDRGMARFFDRLDTAYGNAVRWVLYHKFLFLFVLIVMFGASIFMAFKIGFVNMPTQESDTVAIDVTMPQGTRLEVTEEVLHRLEAIARNEIDGFERMAISVGSAGAFDSIFGSSTNTGRLEIALPDFKNRRDTDEVVKTKMRRHFEDFPGASFAFASSVMGGVGGSSGIDVIIKSEDLNLARSTAEAVKAALEKQAAEYVTEPQMDLTDGLPQVNIVIDRERLYNLGLNIYSVSNEIKANINGQLAGRYRDGGNEIDIVVSLDESDREKLNDLEQIFVTNSSGSRIPLSSFAAYQEGTSPVSINRENQARTVHVTAAT